MREKAAEVEKEKLEQKRIMPRIMASQDYLIQKDGGNVNIKVNVSQILDKRIILFVGFEVISSTLGFLPELVRWYEEISNKDDKFEVIYISRDKYEAMFNGVFQRMPWLAFPFGSRHQSGDMLADVKDFLPNGCYLIALGQDGVIVTKDAAKHFRSRGVDAYPFTDADLLENVSLKLATRLVWTVTDKEGQEYIPNYWPSMYPRYSQASR